MSLKLNRWTSFFLLLIIAFGAGSASAQEGDPLGPQYIVQPGDTLSSIALRFDVSMNEIITASQLANPDALNVGDVLVLPGLDWIDGVLVFEDLGYGESFLSLRRRYLLSAESMARLNRLTSPSQLYVGFPLLLATERGEMLQTTRALVAPGASLLEIAVVNAENPWAIAAHNQLAGTWQAIPGDVLFTPAREDAGPGGLPSPVSRVDVQLPGFVQGKTSVIRIHSPKDLALGGELIGNQLHFFENVAGEWLALQGVPLEAESGTFALTLTGAIDSAPFSFVQFVRVQAGGYSRETLTVDPQLLNPELSAAETVQIREIVSAASAERKWSGFWGAPHPYIGVINSEFGVHRSYNGDSYQSFHYGVDFGGGLGIEIWAPAPGVVVFAAPLELRGNATIIDHGWGIYSGYFHQSELLVAVGDQVTTGQLIGRVGNTGRSTGAHLHWEVWANGVSVEPLDWLARVFP